MGTAIDSSGAPVEASQLDDLAAEFKPSQHQTRRGGGVDLTYISIDATINRLNAVLGGNWATRANTSLIKEALDEGNYTYLALCELQMDVTVDGIFKTAYGVGAMRNKDPDMAAKTALAEAIKKAGHQLGIGLYLWDDDKRALVEKKMALAGASEAKQKAAVYQLARDRLGKTKPTAQEVAELFGREQAEMLEPETNRAILEAEGLI